MDISKKIEAKKQRELLNTTLTLFGCLFIVVGIVFSNNNILSNIFYGIGASVFASGLVMLLQNRYLVASYEADNWISNWRVYDLFDNKSEMNIIANEALEKCTKSIDIIVEGMTGYRQVKGSLLKEKIKNGIKIRIISCDSAQMLAARRKDEDNLNTNDSLVVQHVLDLKKWYDDIREEYSSANIELRFHSTYPAFSFLKIDDLVFVGPNMWRRKSQYSFALGFNCDGRGGKQFIEYFEELWNDASFVHSDCRLISNNDG